MRQIASLTRGGPQAYRTEVADSDFTAP